MRAKFGTPPSDEPKLGDHAAMGEFSAEEEVSSDLLNGLIELGSL